MKLSGCWFKSHQRHCVVSLSKTIYPLLSTGSTKETCKIGVALSIPYFTSLSYETLSCDPISISAYQGEIEWLLIQVASEALCCVLEQDNLSTA